MRKVLIGAGFSANKNANLADVVKEVEASGADYIHLDAADIFRHMPHAGLIWGPSMVEMIRPHTTLPIEVHANVDGIDERHIVAYAKAGANMIVLPSESYIGHRLAFLIQCAHENGMQFGLTVSPAGPPSLVENSIYEIDRLIVYARDAHSPEGGVYEPALRTIKQLRKKIDEEHINCVLCTDGASNVNSIAKIAEAGPDCIENSRSVFATGKSIKESIDDLRNALSKANI